MMDAGVRYVGAHPMAGQGILRHRLCHCRFASAAPALSLTPTEQTDQPLAKILSALALELGFRKTVVATPEEHDQVIAYTSPVSACGFQRLY